MFTEKQGNGHFHHCNFSEFVKLKNMLPVDPFQIFQATEILDKGEKLYTKMFTTITSVVTTKLNVFQTSTYIVMAKSLVLTHDGKQ